MSLEGRTIGVIEDDAIMGESLVQSLGLAGSEVVWWRTCGEAVEALKTRRPDLIVCDIRLPDADGADLFRRMASRGSVTPFLFMTAYGRIEEAVALIRDGAGDYVTKPFDMQEFIGKAASLMTREPGLPDDCALGVSAQMRKVEATLQRAAPRLNPLLIIGKTGTGKEVAARYLHRIAHAPQEVPFIAVNCAAIPGELMESELFGHEKGAFSGATAAHRGYAERARHGTLFLDEIGDLPLPMQAKLLRLIEARSFARVGGETTLPFKARVVCATNADLEDAVAKGRFREDLYYRINVICVSLPPLSARVDDILWLLRRFVREIAAETGCEQPMISSMAEQAAVSHAWPGNVRELRNRVERALLMAQGSTLMPADLFPEFGEPGIEPAQFPSLRTAREHAERLQIERALRETNGQLGEAARILDVSRTTLWEKIKRHGIVAPEDDA